MTTNKETISTDERFNALSPESRAFILEKENKLMSEDPILFKSYMKKFRIKQIEKMEQIESESKQTEKKHTKQEITSTPEPIIFKKEIIQEPQKNIDLISNIKREIPTQQDFTFKKIDFNLLSDKQKELVDKICKDFYTDLDNNIRSGFGLDIKKIAQAIKIDINNPELDLIINTAKEKINLNRPETIHSLPAFKEKRNPNKQTKEIKKKSIKNNDENNRFYNFCSSFIFLTGMAAMGKAVYDYASSKPADLMINKFKASIVLSQPEIKAGIMVLASGAAVFGAYKIAKHIKSKNISVKRKVLDKLYSRSRTS